MTHSCDDTKHPVVDCVLCGRAERACAMDPIGPKMIEKQWCFYCLHWEEKAAEPGLITTDTPEGFMAYVVGPELPASLPRGYGGRRFLFKVDDGEGNFSTLLGGGNYIATSNLWSGEVVPQLRAGDSRFRARYGTMLTTADFPGDSPDFDEAFDQLIAEGCYRKE